VDRRFVKYGPPAQVAAEAAGLRWLAETGTVPVVEVLAVEADRLELAFVVDRAPGAAEAEAFGRDLADLHAAGADTFGAPWPGFIGPLPMSNEPAASFLAFYVGQRVLPFVAAARDRGALTAAQALTIESACHSADESAEAPSRIHGDLWRGNVLWPGRACLIDPAAHGGHRETDLAMLALFGAPHLERILAAYDEHRPLAPGWRERVGFHQLHPLLVHAVLFGPPYGAQAVAAARGRPAGDGVIG
jgi:fructosamine-3-kinase